MTTFRKTKVVNIKTDAEVGADILSQSDRVLKVALDNTTISLTLHKKRLTDEWYVGQVHGMEFKSRGNHG